MWKCFRDKGNTDRLLEMVVDLFYPRRCPVCHEIAMPKGQLVCTDCRKKLHPIGEPCCKKCGKPVENQETEYCFDCAKGRHRFETGVALYTYDSVMQRSIMYFKFYNRREYAACYGEEIERCLGKKLRSWHADCLVPIPIHKSKYRSRGFNQAEVLAKEISKRTGIPCDMTLLKRIKKTLPQKELNSEERRKNLEDAFQIARSGVKYKKIILVDDIYTTGSTMDACAEVLKRAGAAQIYCLSLCIGSGCDV